jgi:bacteriocin-like protein
VTPGPTNFKTGEEKMETLTKKEMFEIEGGDWWDFAEGLELVLTCALAFF